MWKYRNYSPEMRELPREVGELYVKLVKFGFESGGFNA